MPPTTVPNEFAGQAGDVPAEELDENFSALATAIDEGDVAARDAAIATVKGEPPENMDTLEKLAVQVAIAVEDASQAVNSTIEIGTVETLAPGEDATATLSGPPTARVLDLGIPTGSDGEDGVSGWTANVGIVADGSRRVQLVTGWSGGTGAPPPAGVYVGADGYVEAIEDAEDVRGESGAGGGDKGWSPDLAAVVDGARRVAQVADWLGGEGDKPATGGYLGAGGLVADIADATDLRGAPGGDGDDGAPGPQGDPGWTAPAVLAWGATVTPDLDDAKGFTLTATGAFALAAPDNATAGMTFWIEITQDGTGGRACSFASAYKFSGGIAPLLSVAAGAVDVLYCVVAASGRIHSSLQRDMAAGA